MRTLVLATLALSSLALMEACGGSHAGVYLRTGGNGAPYVEGPLEPGSIRLKADVCSGSEMAPDFATLDENAFVRFFEAQGYKASKVRARSDLVYVDLVFEEHEDPIRFRVAILPSTPDAGHELHEAILQHGPGSWGVHRSNLAVLAPIGSPDEMIAFVAKTKLACWGVLTYAGRDDTFVVPGGYTEL